MRLKGSKPDILKMKVYQLETINRFTPKSESLYSKNFIQEMLVIAARQIAFEEALMFRYVWKWGKWNK